ncbi:uncharacterized protein SCHCODRAFT_02505173 [Schizophyllum commune H4-8]|uniref:uncharacterized protein n=1 Tax=Schizophyllum commune (strain H4-8 / FGSC 9210) TaxID=578458 RepID=UPI002160E0B4|nr:uncharacterized protein SCHCODRAFT_02505173 [Schizophyllum commune H4-8]KAI5891789.1 hypothetical protein SCHCODRAFT_02505173 [Schizophyllum commune H4-8]
MDRPRIIKLQPAHTAHSSDEDWSDEEKEFAFLERTFERPMAASYTLSSLRNQLDPVYGDLNLDPSYRRRASSLSVLATISSSPRCDLISDTPPWDDEKQMRFIDTLFRGIYAPSIIFAPANVRNSRRYKRVCIDGKQRLTAIYRFMEGEIPCAATGNRYWYKVKRGEEASEKKVISEQYRRRFDTTMVIAIEYKKLLNEAQQREIHEVRPSRRDKEYH